MISWQGRLLTTTTKLLFKPIIKLRSNSLTNENEIRKNYRRIEALAGRIAPPSACNIQADQVGKVACEWVSWGDSPNIPNSEKKIIVYYHGSAFIILSPKSYRMFTWRLAKETGYDILVPDYRMAPDHHHPAAANDSIAIYEDLLERGYRPENIIIGGDSAGGNLTLVSLMQIKNRKYTQPAAAFCISPWTDLSGSGTSMKSNAKADPFFPPDNIIDVARIYAPDTDLSDPLISPAFADYSGFPPLLIFVGSTEILLDDAQRVVDGARKANVPVLHKIWHRMPHSFPVLAAILPEGRQAITEIADFAHKQFKQAQFNAAATTDSAQISQSNAS